MAGVLKTATMPAGVPKTLHAEVLRRFFAKHNTGAASRIDLLLDEHGFELLGERLQEKYAEHPLDLWHGSLKRATVLYDYPENGHPMVGPLDLASGAITLREGEVVMITDTGKPAPGWVMGYKASSLNPKIGTFPIAFTSAGGAKATRQSEKGNLKARARRPRSVDILENGNLGERAPVVKASVPAHWGPRGSATGSKRTGPKSLSGADVPTASADPAWAQYRENLATFEHSRQTLRNSRKSGGDTSSLTPWRGEAWAEASAASASAAAVAPRGGRAAADGAEAMQPLVGSSHGLGGGERRKPTRGGAARQMGHHPRTDGHTERVKSVAHQNEVRFAPKGPRFTAKQRKQTRVRYKEPADEHGPEPHWADDLVVTVRYIPTLYASTDTPNSVTLVADDDARMSDIKLMLQQQLGVSANRMRLAHGETGEVLQDGKTLKDYGISSDITLDGIWTFKDQTHNPQLALQLPHTHERHQWSYARQGRHQPLEVARCDSVALFQPLFACFLGAC